MKILNLYAGLGGNRKLWNGEITAIDIDAQSRAMVRAEEKPKPNPQTTLGDSPIPPTDKSVGILGDD